MISLSSFLLNLPDFPYINIPEYTLKFTLISKLKLGYLGGYGVYQETLREDIRRLRENGWMYKEISHYLTERGYMSSRGNSTNLRSEVSRFAGSKEVSVILIKQR